MLVERKPAPGVSDASLARQGIACSGNAFVIRVRLADRRVVDAWSTGRMLRNMNAFLRGGLDDRGRLRFVQQAHCLCNDGHALAAARAVEDLAETPPPRAALLVRSLVQALRFIQEHLLHVYHFHLTDWVNPEAALRADPAKSAELAREPGVDAAFFRRAQDRLRALSEDAKDVDASESGDHPAYRGVDEMHLLLGAHGRASLRAGAVLTAALDLLGCGPDGFRAYRPGGLPEDMDLGEARLHRVRGLLTECRDFVQDVFLPDLQCLARTYAHWTDFGAGCAFLSCDEFAHPVGDGPFFPGGIVVSEGGDEVRTWAARPFRGEEVREEADPNWSATDRERYRLLPGAGGPSFTWEQDGFFWLPAPRCGDGACETGPPARMLNGWARGQKRIRRVMSDALAACGFVPADMNSTLGRVLSRGVESAVLAEAALDWLDALAASLAHGGGKLRRELRPPASGRGMGRVEAPRGMLTHDIRLEEGHIAAHDHLVPSLWNFSPRDGRGERGPLERALLGTPVADPGRPLEILRTVHELDPCNACWIVVEDVDAGGMNVVKT